MTSDVPGEERDQKLLSELERIIGGEVDKLNPKPESRNALVLIARGRIHPIAGQAQDEPNVRYLVFDEKGQPRTRHEDGREVVLTISDVVAELRERFPKLFEGPPESETVPIAKEPERDWLSVASATEAETQEEAQTVPTREPESLTAPAQAMADSQLSVVREKFESAAQALKVAAVDIGSKVSRSQPSRPWVRSALACLIGAVVFLTLLAVVIGKPGSLFVKPETPTTGSTTSAPSAQGGSPAGVNQQVVRGIPEVIDTTTLKIGDEVIHLYGVEWARGGNADQLRRYVGDREATCRKATPTDTFRCEVDARDLSTVVLFNGGARTASDAPPELLAAEQHARSEGKGVWKK